VNDFVYQNYGTRMNVYHPWFRDPDIAQLMTDLNQRRSLTLVDWDHMWILKWAFQQTRGIPHEIWELGVYRGGSALMLRRLIDKAHPSAKPGLRLFDSFKGLPKGTEGIDLHSQGDFADTSLEEVRALVGDDEHIDYRVGWIPSTFAGLDGSAIRMAHIDLDLYRPILDACDYVYPRLATGGVIVFDDYGLHSCPGARQAVDEFFSKLPETLLALPTGQAVLVKSRV
jgi:O-methyltransferase